MRALNHFLLAQLRATPTGQVRLCALATGLRQAEASAKLHSATVLLPPHAIQLQIGT